MNALFAFPQETLGGKSGMDLKTRNAWLPTSKATRLRSRLARIVFFPIAFSSTLVAANNPVDFTTDVLPLMSRLGCNGSSCHGKAEGQNGFKLSVFEHDPEGDFQALTMESRGRRILPTAPEQSLLLRKITGEVGHGGGGRTT